MAGRERHIAQIIAKAWGNEEFKARLLSDPAQALQECGYTMPEGVEVKVLEDTENVIHLVLPPQPSRALTEEELDAVAGGGLPRGFTSAVSDRQAGETVIQG